MVRPTPKIAWYYPFGMQMPGRNGNTGEYRYAFNGMESDDEVKGTKNSYDFGARIYDPRVARWLSRDAYEKKYPSLNPYNFVANTPINAMDPDGNLIIFINGLDNYVMAVTNAALPTPHWSDYAIENEAQWSQQMRTAYNSAEESPDPQGSSYWQGFDKRLSNVWEDQNRKYVDGSPGALLENISDDFRYKKGYSAGVNSAEATLKQLKPGETIKIVTHSMGGVFGRGYAEGLKKEMEGIVEKHNLKVTIEKTIAWFKGETYNGPGYMKMPKISVVDVAPYSNDGEGRQAVSGIDTYQMSGDKDDISGDKNWSGSRKIATSPGTGHSINEYKSSDLKAIKKDVNDEK